MQSADRYGGSLRRTGELRRVRRRAAVGYESVSESFSHLRSRRADVHSAIIVTLSWLAHPKDHVFVERWSIYLLLPLTAAPQRHPGTGTESATGRVRCLPFLETFPSTYGTSVSRSRNTLPLPLPMAFTFALPDARRIRSYFLRLPLATRILILIITAFYIAHLFWPGITQWGALIPQEIGISSRIHPTPLSSPAATYPPGSQTNASKKSTA